MSTAVMTGKSRPESKRGYTPGAQVDDRRKGKRAKTLTRRPPSLDLPSELLDKILSYMVESRSGLSVIKLGMVNRYFREAVGQNLKIWYQLYLHWRGPINPDQRVRTVQTPRGVVRLRPTLPTTVPNFRNKAPPTT
jgi:hypothetical protein